MSEIGLESFLNPLLALGFLMFLLLIGLYNLAKIRRPIIALILWLFSVIIGMESMKIPYLPFTPFLQAFIILMQTYFFVHLAVKGKLFKNKTKR
jgi:hypothetical protein